MATVPCIPLRTGIYLVIVAILSVILLQVRAFAGPSHQPDLSPATARNSSWALDSTNSPSQCKEIPLLMAEGSNSCEIVSCGMGIKDTCKITCPTDKTPKCSCDCLKTFGPMCTEYKANCRCE